MAAATFKQWSRAAVAGVVVAVGFGGPPAWAWPVKLQGVVALGFDFGGAEVAQATYGGHRLSLSSVEGFRFAGGVLFAPFLLHGHSVELEVTGGFKRASSSDETLGAFSLDRWLVEGLVFYRYEKAFFRVGGGLSYHIAPTLVASSGLWSLAGFTSVDLGSALGFVLQAELAVGRNGGATVGVRYIFMRYPGVPGERSIPASGFGVVLSGSYGADFWRPRSD